MGGEVCRMGMRVGEKGFQEVGMAVTVGMVVAVEVLE